MEQKPLFVTDIYDALTDIVRALGGPKEVGSKLRPEKAADEAATWVKDCLNRARRERFNPEQILWLLREGREVECHVAMSFMCEYAGYENPTPRNPDTEAEKLQRQIITATEVLKTSLDRLERLRQPALQSIPGGRS